MDLDSFSASTKASSVTQVDDLWHGRQAHIDAFHPLRAKLHKRLHCVTQKFYSFFFRLHYDVQVDNQSFGVTNILLTAF